MRVTINQENPQKLTCTHTYTLIHKDRGVKLYIQREKYIHSYAMQETHKIHKHIKNTHRDKEKQSKKTQETRNTQKPI